VSAPLNKASEDRAFCPAASRDGRRCDFAEHPGAVHWSWVEGELQFWQALPEPGEAWRNQAPAEDPLRDAPQALKTARGPRAVGFFVDEFPSLMQQAEANPMERKTMSQIVHRLLVQGRTLEPYHRPLVEATTVNGDFAYGLLEAPYSSGHGQPVVHETVPESGGVPSRVAILVDSIREVLVPGHRGGCAGDCCREGYSEDTSYPECWTWDQVRSGIAEKYRAWKDWTL
jgi:hypothetical protein